MHPFTEENAVEGYVRDLLCGKPSRSTKDMIEQGVDYVTAGVGARGAGWHFIPAVALPRQANDVFVEQHVRDALIRLNPSIEADPNRAGEVIHKLRGIMVAALVPLLLFLTFTQREAVEVWIAYLGTAAAGSAGVLKLLGMLSRSGAQKGGD